MKPELTNIAISSLLRREFKRATSIEGYGEVKIPRPPELKKFGLATQVVIRSARDELQKARDEFNRRTAEISSQGITGFAATQLAARSLWIEAQLVENGGVYGDKTFNFVVDPLKIPKPRLDQIKQTALSGLKTLSECTPPLTEDATASEKLLDSLNLRPDSARVDIIDTPQGPRIIEINTQWVDAIQALEAMQIAVQGKSETPSPTTLLSRSVRKTGKALGIIDYTTSSGSRSTGPKSELENLSRTIEDKNLFGKVELIYPEKTRPEYLEEFDSFYLNGSPSSINNSEPPDWLEKLVDLMRRGRAKVIPSPAPRYDRKLTLIEAWEKYPGFAPTSMFSKENAGKALKSGPIYVKGNAYSSREVSLVESETSLPEYLNYNPREYVIQPVQVPSSLPPLLCRDTSNKTFTRLDIPFAKYNIWVLNDRIAGLMLSVSSQEIISDKDFNTIPIPI